MSEKILVPVLGESITEATVSKWLKNEGDPVEADEPLVELETDKVNLEVPSPVSGVLTKINSKNGSVVEVGADLGSVSESENKSKDVEKVILCSGKVYFDLLEAREKIKKDNVVLYRIEQLYPFPAKALANELKPDAKNAKFYWCQEEPKNMGAWFSVRDYIQWTLDNIKAKNSICLLYTSPSPRD